MKTIISKLLLVAVIGGYVFTAASCNCGGCEQTIITEGAELRVNDSISIRSSNAIELSVQEISSARKEKSNKCMDKVLRVCTNDALSLELLTVQCNKDLKLRTETIVAGKNLIDLAKSNQYTPLSGAYFAVKLPLSDTFASGNYTFILAGKTKDGKPVNDTAIILWK